MVRGHAKAVAQARNQAKQEEKSKSIKRDGNESRAIRDAGLTLTCPICFSSMHNAAVLKNHFEQRHPGKPLPANLQ